MICKRTSDDKCFNYRFINDAVIELSIPRQPEETTYVLYENWRKNYFVIDKWNILT